MVCNHGNKVFVGKNWETRSTYKYTEAVFYCPDCSTTVVKRIDHVHMDTPEIRALFSPRVAESQKKHQTEISPYKRGFVVGFLVATAPLILKLLEII